MANKKFSEFTLKTDSANVDFVVGYDGTQRSVGVLRGLLPSDNCAAPIGIQYIFHIHSEKHAIMCRELQARTKAK